MYIDELKKINWTLTEKLESMAFVLKCVLGKDDKDVKSLYELIDNSKALNPKK